MEGLFGAILIVAIWFWIIEKFWDWIGFKGDIGSSRWDRRDDI